MKMTMQKPTTPALSSCTAQGRNQLEQHEQTDLNRNFFNLNKAHHLETKKCQDGLTQQRKAASMVCSNPPRMRTGVPMAAMPTMAGGPRRTAVRFLGKHSGKTTTRTNSSMIQRPEPAEKNDGGVHTSSRPNEKHCTETGCARSGFET